MNAQERFPCWIADPAMPGAARPVSGAEIDALLAQGLTVYGSLAGCVLHAGVQASAFDAPLRNESFWNSADVVANGMSTQGLAPAGRRARYKVIATAP